MNELLLKNFELEFTSQTLANHIDKCDNYELSKLFLSIFRDNQPVLEAGCGSGRWCVWLFKHAIQCDGIDLSEELCKRASQEYPQLTFLACDMQNTPFEDKSYGAIMALGSIEHNIAGPSMVLREFNRLLKFNGKAVITVPYGGKFRILFKNIRKSLLFLKPSSLVHHFMKGIIGGPSQSQIRLTANRSWHPVFMHSQNGMFFYQYEFNKVQMRTFLREAGFLISQEFVAFKEEGILHTFGRVAGKWNVEQKLIEFTFFGKIVKSVFPKKIVGHMLCYVIEKRAHHTSQKLPGSNK